MPESGMNKIIQWASKQEWTNVTNVISTHEKAKNLQDTLFKALDECLPQKNYELLN